MSQFEPHRARLSTLTADGYLPAVGDYIWHPSDLSRSVRVKSFPADFATTGLVNITGSTVHLSVYYYQKINALYYKRQLISEKLQDGQRAQGETASELKTIDDEIEILSSGG